MNQNEHLCAYCGEPIVVNETFTRDEETGALIHLRCKPGAKVKKQDRRGVYPTKHLFDEDREGES